jgi:hypothetical protein
MVWLFERDGDETLTIESRYDPQTDNYQITLTRTDGVVQTEVFKTANALKARLLALEGSLAREKWAAKSEPTLLSDAWHL